MVKSFTVAPWFGHNGSVIKTGMVHLKLRRLELSDTQIKVTEL
jgi:hypothetical protein